MTRGERACQIWPLLVMSATQRQLVTYDRLGRLIGVPRHGLGQLLEPIQSLCILNHLPPLSSLVVSEIDGMPGAGFIAAQDIPKAHSRVFAFDWFGVTPPGSADLEAAGTALPSNGRSLEELQLLAKERR